MKTLIIATVTFASALSLMAGPNCCGAKGASADAKDAHKDMTETQRVVAKAKAAGDTMKVKDRACPADKDCAKCPEKAHKQAKADKHHKDMRAKHGKHHKGMQAKNEHATIDTDALKKLIAADVEMTILDARTGKYDDGRRIPGAASLSPKADKATVAETIPNKDSLVVTYCGNVKCPLSNKLAAHLKDLGYTNVIEYPAGISGWVESGHSVEKVASN